MKAEAPSLTLSSPNDKDLLARERWNSLRAIWLSIRTNLARIYCVTRGAL